MLILIKVSCAGKTFSYPQGSMVDAPSDIAKDLIEGGFAEEVKKPPSKPKAGAKENADT